MSEREIEAVSVGVVFKHLKINSPNFAGRMGNVTLNHVKK